MCFGFSTRKQVSLVGILLREVLCLYRWVYCRVGVVSLLQKIQMTPLITQESLAVYQYIQMRTDLRMETQGLFTVPSIR